MPVAAIHTKPTLKSKGSLNTVIRVDRSIRPVYPNWVRRVMRPDLECAGAARYNLMDIDLWLHEGQTKDSVVKGYAIHRHLISTNSLPSCLGLRDAEEIQKKGIGVFRKLFGATIFFWKSVLQRDDGFLSVRYLYEHYTGEVVLDFLWLGDDWISVNPAARFGRLNV